MKDKWTIFNQPFQTPSLLIKWKPPPFWTHYNFKTRIHSLGTNDKGTPGKRRISFSSSMIGQLYISFLCHLWNLCYCKDRISFLYLLQIDDSPPRPHLPLIIDHNLRESEESFQQSNLLQSVGCNRALWAGFLTSITRFSSQMLITSSSTRCHCDAPGTRQVCAP